MFYPTVSILPDSYKFALIRIFIFNQKSSTEAVTLKQQSEKIQFLSIQITNMMSQHINSMLEHLKMGGKKSKVSNGNLDSVDQNQLYKDSNGVDEVDKVGVVVNDVKKTKNHVHHKDGCANCDGSDEKFDPRKRFSVSGGQNLNSVTVKHGNGEVQHFSAGKELLASPRNMQRKLSQDLRRGINFPTDDGFECSKYRKPVKLKSMISHYETYDSLHTKAIEVSRCTLL